ncbi:DUF2332 domain-containing protein [Pelomonas sp. SE-A7]|uniref:DUF2332 domain-containing protein n=1 Tax=Pelomonas sp. SE-A7 TaxID=3054953 RepID=UPI00259D173D|nr:DUF2332 domain-containing protein [Pelomonas sp. SE-A7]MDM4768321.1 DUF2332 domain-containing protein [Pelomonas sp. SE-A7]
MDIAEFFRRFAERECPHDPLYQALSRCIAATPELLALMDEAPPTQRKPVLLLAALHEQVLAAVGHGLAAYYGSVGGERAPDAELPALLLDFVERHRHALVETLRRRSTQTNETGRCAVLWPALQHIARVTGRPDLALFDFGSSAGLNLGVDAYRYDYGDFQRGAHPEPGRPLIRCEWRGGPPPGEAAGFRLGDRLGVDPHPIDLADPAEVRWLQACLWPSERERTLRLKLAIGLARASAWPVQRAADGLGLLVEWLDRLPAGVQPVLLNSWVLFYFDKDGLALHYQRVAELVRSRGLVWLNAEMAALHPPGLVRPDLSPEGPEAGSATLWSLQRAEQGELIHEPLAWSHPHGRWLDWIASYTSAPVR